MLCRKKKLKGLLCIVLTVALLANETMWFSKNVYATSDASVEQARQDKADAEAKRDEAQKGLDILEDIKSGIQSAIVDLDMSITKMQAKITELEMDQKELEDSIQQTQADLETAKAAEEKQYEMMKQRENYGMPMINMETSICYG